MLDVLAEEDRQRARLGHHVDERLEPVGIEEEAQVAAVGVFPAGVEVEDRREDAASRAVEGLHVPMFPMNPTNQQH